MCPNPQETVDLTTFTEKILNGKIHFLCSDKTSNYIVNIRVEIKNSEFKNIEFHDFTVSTETIISTKQEFFFTKVDPVQSITDIAPLGFSLILLPGMLISYYTIIYFFVIFFFFECLYFGEYDIRMFLFVFWLRNRPSIKYVRN